VRVGGRPVIDYVLERLAAAGASEIRVVTRPDKRDVAEHARGAGATVIEGEPPTVARSLLLALDGLAPRDVVLVGLPDTIWEPPDGFVSLVAELERDGELALGVFPSTEPERGDVVALDEAGRVLGVEVKPARPASNLVWGCAAARAGALAGLADVDEPGHLFDALARAGKARGICFPREFVDIGTRTSLERARALLDARR
jgi:glucose-1-phosphate thymidylyltransferase